MYFLYLALAVAIVAGFVLLKREKLEPTFPTGYIPRYPADFGIFNYLERPITVVISSNGENKVLSKDQPSHSRIPVYKEDVIKYFTPDSVINIFLGDKHYSSLILDTKRLERIKNLHVGMITSRYIGSTTDTLRMLTTANNAMQGNAWLKIHNISDVPLRLRAGLEPLTSEPDIVIEPHSTHRYLGYRDQGVTLGTYFVDLDGLYPNFQYLIPNSDLYYGLSSDLTQPTQGCFQLEFNDDCEYGQTLWPFEMGQM